MASKPPIVKLRDGTPLKRVSYSKLSNRAQENYNFAKVAAILADFGFSTMRLSDDWHGADFIAHDPKGGTLLVQLKGRLEVNKKYMYKNAGQHIYVCFPTRTQPRVWFMYHHDTLLVYMLRTEAISRDAWARNAGQSRLNPSKNILSFLKKKGCELGTESEG